MQTVWANCKELFPNEAELRHVCAIKLQYDPTRCFIHEMQRWLQNISFENN